MCLSGVLVAVRGCVSSATGERGLAAWLTLRPILCASPPAPHATCVPEPTEPSTLSSPPLSSSSLHLPGSPLHIGSKMLAAAAAAAASIGATAAPGRCALAELVDGEERLCSTSSSNSFSPTTHGFRHNQIGHGKEGRDLVRYAMTSPSSSTPHRLPPSMEIDRWTIASAAVGEVEGDFLENLAETCADLRTKGRIRRI
ncbi:hypothetical protein VPH35_069137 [Triticum aestivum]